VAVVRGLGLASTAGLKPGTTGSGPPFLSSSLMVWIGTSGYNYPEWKGSFYPDKLPAAKMLPYYAERFRTVEINYTFYRVPTEAILNGWVRATPEEFRFTLKAPRRITHDAKLQQCADLTQLFCARAQGLGSRLGLLLFQLPPAFRCDLAVLDGFLDTLPPRCRAAFEFRHPSWLVPAVFERLARRNLALCIADSERLTTPVVATADYGYLRLRDEGYQDADLAGWARVILDQRDRWQDTFVYFKHEEQGKGPEFTRRLLERLNT
jgi:uncharacterized protein YecE (DUF72 family)